MKDEIKVENLKTHIENLERAGGHFSRVNFTPGNDSGAAYIYNEFKKIPGLEVKLDTFYISSAQSPFNLKPLVNVIAELKGVNAHDKPFILGAHFDCSASRMGSSVWNSQWQTIKTPGADDNATGVAALLEIARVIADTSFHFQPDYSIRLVAFGAEESGPAYSGSHYGSIHYAKNLRANGESISCMCSVDMIGYNPDYNFNSIVANSSSELLGKKYIEANELFDIDLMLNEPPFPPSTFSDHLSFWDEGYNAICMIEYAPPWNDGPFYRANPYYHTSDDTAGTLNLELVKKVTQLNLAAASAFASRLTISDIEDNVLPEDFALFQNYPNPFNSTTKIKFTIPFTPLLSKERGGGEVVSLRVYDILGNEIAILVNEEKSAGEYEVEFDGNGLTSGVYFCKLQMGTASKLIKMILLQ
jgi:hypothetical protein